MSMGEENSLQEKKHYLQDVKKESKVIERELRGSEFKIENVLMYLAELPKDESAKNRVSSIINERDPEKRKKLIEKHVKQAFKNFFGFRVDPEVVVFFCDYMEEQMQAKNEKDERIKEVIEETRKLLGKELGNVKPYKPESYMNSTGEYFQDKGIEGFKGGKAKDSQTVLEYTTPEKVLSYLSDIKGTGDLGSKENKKGVLSAQQLDQTFKNLEAKPNGTKKLLKSISYIMSKATGEAVEFKSKDDLHNFLKSNPQAKAKFLDFVLEQRARMGVDMNEFFQDPANALKRTMDNKDKIENNPKLQMTIEEIGRMMEGKLDKEISSLEKKAKSATGENKIALEKALAYIKAPENKKSVIDSFKLRAAGGFASWLKDFGGRDVTTTQNSVTTTKYERTSFSGVIGMDIGNDAIDKYLKEYVKVFQNFDIDIGMGIVNGMPHIGVGARLTGRQELSKDLSIKYILGTYLLIPYAVLGVDYMTNRSQLESLKGLVGKELDVKSAQSIGIIGNISAVGASAGVYWSRDKLRGIETQKDYFEKMLNKICKLENLNKDPNTLYAELQKTPEGKNLKEDDRESMKVILENINKSLASFDDYNRLNPQQKQNFIEKNVKKALVNRWNETALLQAEKEGWYFGGIFLGVHTWLNFLPSISILPDFKKITTEFVADPESEAMNVGKKLTGVGEHEMGGTIQDFAQSLQKLIDTNSGGKSDVRIDDGKIVISMKSKTDPLLYVGNIHYNPAIKNQIKYDGKQIIIGNVGAITPYYEVTNKGRKLSLYLGGKGDIECTSDMNINNKDQAIAELGANEPSAMQQISNRNTGSTNIENSVNMDKGLTTYLRNNINNFVGFQWRHPQEYKAFLNTYAGANYPQAANHLINMLSVDSKFKKDHTVQQALSNLRQLKSAQPGTEQFGQLEMMIGQFANILMVDANTVDKLLSPEKRKQKANSYINEIFGNANMIKIGNREITKGSIQRIVEDTMADPSRFTDFKGILLSLFAYKEDQYILTNSAKKLYYLLRPVNDFQTERSKAFDNLAKKEGVGDPSLDRYRKASYDKLMSGGDNGWTTSVDDKMLGMYASYKLTQDNKSRIFSGFGFTAPGVTEIATNGKTGERAITSVDESDVAAKTWVINNISKYPYFKNTQRDISNVLGVNLNEADTKRLLIDGHINVKGNEYKIDRQIVFYLNGLCANEGFGLRLDKISGPKGDIDVTFGFNGHVTTNIPQASQTSLFLGAMGTPGHRKSETTVVPSPECIGNADITSSQGSGTGPVQGGTNTIKNTNPGTNSGSGNK